MGTGKVSNLNVAHFSMQFSDTRDQVEADAERIFTRGYDWITGTEAGDYPVRIVLKKAARRHGYTFHEYKSNWVAIDKSLIVMGTRRTGHATIVDGKLTAGIGNDSNIVWDTFRTSKYGTITVMASHYPTRGNPDAKMRSRRVNVRWTKKLAVAIGAKTKQFGSGPNLVFYGGDQNIVDRITDTFFGQPLTSVWDELGRWENTGHGNIDVIASYDKDSRVKALYGRALDDSELFMHTDHFPVEAGFSVKHLK